jgi:uncharacterized small protein (DUF1192 family)
MGERRNMPAEDTAPPADDKAMSPKAAMTTAALAEAVKLVDQELDRQCRVYDAAHAVRACVGASIQAVIAECQALDARKAALQAEVATLQAQLGDLKESVGKARGSKA